MDLKGKYYIKTFCGTITAGVIIEEFRDGSNLYVCYPFDIDEMAQQTYYEFTTLNDFIIGGYIFFDNIEEMCEELEVRKAQLEALKESAKAEKETETKEAV